RYHAETLQMLVSDRTRKLAEAKESLEAILRHVGDPIFVCAADGQIAQTNPRATELLAALPPDERECLLQAVAATDRRQSAETLELAGEHYQVAATPIGDDQSAVVVLHNVTRFKELDELKSVFVSNVSHELRAPISNVKLAHSMLRAGVPPETALELWNLVEHETGRLERLIEDLLDLSRLELGGTGLLNLISIQLGQVASWAVKRHAEMARQRNQTLTFEVDPATPEVRMDQHQMMQVITNLLVNAINYTPQGGSVKVSVQPSLEGETVILKVADTGYGIPPEERPRLFERFYRGRAAQQSRAAGTGLGLAICKEIMALHHGAISFESEPGRGTTFMVRLPVNQPTV
ncbi:MAG: ATP-binding protein, partial [Chloroflexota bacterium]